jgi:hypothetical protein
MSSVTSRDHPSAVLKATTRTGFGVLAIADIVNDSLFVGCRFIGFEIGATKLAEVVEYDVHGAIVGLRIRS